MPSRRDAPRCRRSEGRVPVELFRIDDRLIHGQVVVGWGQPLDARFILLVDDTVATSDWEQELYRMGVPPEMDVHFLTVDDAIAAIPQYEQTPGTGILLTGDAATMLRLVKGSKAVRRVNVGGIHFRAGRMQRLRYVFLTPEEEETLREMERLGVEVTAQDVPAARAIPLEDVLAGRSDA